MPKRLKFLIVSGFAFVIFGFYFVPNSFAKNYLPVLVEKNAAISNQKLAAVDSPVRLKITRINVDAVLESVGFAAQGAVGVPKNFSNAAWFNAGPRPGDVGNAIITGHYGRKNGKASVFDNLSKIRKGDKVFVKDGRGITASFMVREIRRYDPTAVAEEVFVNNDGKAHLNIITCEGVWNSGTKSYSKRLVIFADKV